MKTNHLWPAIGIVGLFIVAFAGIHLGKQTAATDLSNIPLHLGSAVRLEDNPNCIGCFLYFTNNSGATVTVTEIEKNAYLSFNGKRYRAKIPKYRLTSQGNKLPPTADLFFSLIFDLSNGEMPSMDDSFLIIIDGNALGNPGLRYEIFTEFNLNANTSATIRKAIPSR